MVVTSTFFWNDLPDGIRTQLKTALDEAIAYGNEIAYKKSVNDKQRIIDSGRSQVIELTPEERGLWVEAMKPVWKQFEGEIGKDLIDAAYASNFDQDDSVASSSEAD
jgi:C4-dicarboxylate-binding protein DctP